MRAGDCLLEAYPHPRSAREPCALIGHHAAREPDAEHVVVRSGRAVAVAGELERVVRSHAYLRVGAVGYFDRDVHPVRALAPHKLGHAPARRRRRPWLHLWRAAPRGKSPRAPGESRFATWTTQ